MVTFITKQSDLLCSNGRFTFHALRRIGHDGVHRSWYSYPPQQPFATASANAWRSLGLRTVTQPASRHGDQHESQGARGYGQVKVAAEHASSREEPYQGGAVEGVPRGVRQDGQCREMNKSFSVNMLGSTRFGAKG
jgi:hypothetical protein